MNDLISRRDAIDAIKYWGLIDGLSEGLAIEILEDEEKLPSAQPEMIREIRKWINSNNRGHADYFIVDKIEEIINKYE